MAEVIGVTSGKRVERRDITRGIWEYVKFRGLQYEGDGRVLRVDDKLSKALDIDKGVNDATDMRDKNGLNVWTLQIYLSKVLNN